MRSLNALKKSKKAKRKSLKLAPVTTTNVGKSLGIADDKFLSQLLVQAMKVAPQNPVFEDRCKDALTVLSGIKPKNELEAMLSIQMVGTHNLAMEFMRRASLDDQSPIGINENVFRATKFSRTFVAQLEALNRCRNGGRQKVTVEHVHVHQGGQAIVGNVNKNSDPGEGGKNENSE